MADRTGLWGTAAVAGLLILTAGLYAPSLSHGYVYEDATWRDLGSHAIRLPSRALAVTSHQWAGGPRTDHALNVGLHLLNGGLLALIATTLVGVPAGLWAVLVFLLHPLASSAVLYLTARTDLLMTTGLLLAVWASLWSPRLGAAWLVGLGLLLAATSKEVGLVGAPLVGLTLVCTGRWRAWAPLASTPAGVGVITAAALMGGAVLGRAMTLVPIWLEMAPTGGGSPLPYGEWVSLQLGMLWHLLLLTVWPVGFSIDHDALALSGGWRVLAGLLTLHVLAVLLWAWRRQPTVAWAIGWVVLSVAPRFVFRTSEFVTEPQLYLPLVGLSVLFGMALAAGQRSLTHVPDLSLSR